MTAPARSATPEDTARSFVDAIAWGEHHKVWELLGREGRREVLRVAVSRGMDEALSARLAAGTAARAEQETFLQDLVNGLRADLQGNDLDELRFASDPAPEAGRARVILLAQLPDTLVPGGGLPVGSVELTEEDGTWRVERLLPRPGLG